MKAAATRVVVSATGQREDPQGPLPPEWSRGRRLSSLRRRRAAPTEITAAVRKVDALSTSERSGMGQAARRRYEAEAAKFVETMRAVGEVVCAEAPAGGKAARLDPRLGLE